MSISTRSMAEGRRIFRLVLLAAPLAVGSIYLMFNSHQPQGAHRFSDFADKDDQRVVDLFFENAQFDTTLSAQDFSSYSSSEMRILDLLNFEDELEKDSPIEFGGAPIHQALVIIRRFSIASSLRSRLVTLSRQMAGESNIMAS